MRGSSWLAVISVGAALSAPVCLAQGPAGRRELVGVIRDPAGTPIEGATVGVAGASTQTNLKGAFQLWTGDVDTLTISIRRLGYYPVSALINARNKQWDTVLVEMERNAQELATVKVSGTTTRANGYRDFEERRAAGIGQFVTREEITARNTSRASDVLRATRGVHLVRLRNGQYGVRFALYSQHQPNCVPDLWLDGMRSRGMEIDDIPATDIQGIELYESFSTVPMQFTSTSARPPCGTIVVWTRIPGRP